MKRKVSIVTINHIMLNSIYLTFINPFTYLFHKFIAFKIEVFCGINYNKNLTN